MRPAVAAAERAARRRSLEDEIQQVPAGDRRESPTRPPPPRRCWPIPRRSAGPSTARRSTSGWPAAGSPTCRSRNCSQLAKAHTRRNSDSLSHLTARIVTVGPSPRLRPRLRGRGQDRPGPRAGADPLAGVGGAAGRAAPWASRSPRPSGRDPGFAACSAASSPTRPSRSGAIPTASTAIDRSGRNSIGSAFRPPAARCPTAPRSAARPRAARASSNNRRGFTTRSRPGCPPRRSRRAGRAPRSLTASGGMITTTSPSGRRSTPRCRAASQARRPRWSCQG